MVDPESNDNDKTCTRFDLLGEIDVSDLDNMSASLMEGLHFYGESRFGEALERFKAALVEDPENPNILFNMVMCMMSGNLYETHAELMEIFDRIIALEPKFKDAWANKGSYLAACGNLIDALSCLTRAAELEEDAKVLENRGNVYLELGNYKMALEDFERCIELNGVRSELVYKKGIALMEIRRFDEALACFDCVLEWDYMTTEANLSKAEILLDQGKLKEAIDVCGDILESEPDNMRARGLKGIALHFLGHSERARKELQRVQAIAEERGLEKTQLIRILEKTLEIIET